MRRAALLLTLLVAGCPSSNREVWPVIEDFVAQSTVASCSTVEPPVAEVVTELVTASDSTFLANLGLDRETLLLDHDLRVLARVSYSRQGPRAVMDPRDLTLVDDTIIVYADRPALSLRRFTLGGHVLSPVRLDVPPERVIPWPGGRYLVAATLLSPRQAELLFEVDAEGRARDLGARPRDLTDAQMRTLGNLVVLLPAGPGRALAAHQFVFPVVHSISGTEVLPTRLPVPMETATRVGWVPSRPFEEDELLGIATPVLDADVDRVSGDLLVLTRSGRRTADGSMEKALVRYDQALEYKGSSLLPVNAGHMVSLREGREILLITETDEWVRCMPP